MNAARAAALSAMAARYCDGPMHAGRAEAVAAALVTTAAPPAEVITAADRLLKGRRHCSRW
jgi:hypothetical protein